MNRQLIGLTGAAGAGKDTFAGHFMWHASSKKYNLPAHSVAFASTLKNMACAYFNCSLKELEEYKRDPLHSARHVLQTLGTEWGRKCIDENVWINMLHDKIMKDELLHDAFVLITDVRLKAEVDYIKSHGGLMIFIERPSLAPAGFHSTEATHTLKDSCDYVVINDGTKRDLALDSWEIVGDIVANLNL